MRRTLIALLLLLSPFATLCHAQTSRDARMAYVLKNLGINADTQKKLKPLLQSYLADKKAASAEYSSQKDKLKSSIKNGTLTNDQASKLLTLKWDAEAKETAVKRKYTERFQTVLSAKKTYRCFTLLNDSKDKVQGKKKASAKDDDDED